MSGLVIKRILAAIPALIAVSVIMFGLMNMGSDPLAMLKENPNITAADIKRLTQLNGWDKPVVEQYVSWAGKFVRGDLGTSTTDMRPASEKIGERLPVTLMLTGMALVLSLLIAVPVGAYVAVRKYSKADYVATLTTFGMMAAPSFFLGMLLQLAAIKLQDAAGGTLIFYTAGAPACTSHGMTSVFHCMATPLEMFQRMALPVTALALLHVAAWSRYLRGELLTVLSQDYVRSAMAKGLTGKRVFLRHVSRNAVIPLVTVVGLDAAQLFSGAVIAEQVFGLAGMGNLLFESVLKGDIPVVLGIVMIGAAIVLVMNTLCDVLQGMLDPRVSVS